MGAETSVLEGCHWGDVISCPDSFQWKIYPVSKSDGMEATVLQPKDSDKKESNLLQKSSRMLKQLRHPNIVRYLGCGTSPQGFWLAVEPVTPLLTLTSTVGLTSHELLCGLWDVLQALDFLHSTLGMCHNNLCPASIYVAKDGTWKLGGMEHVCKFSEATPEFLESTRAFRNEQFLSPEEKAGQLHQGGVTPQARDVFSLGVVLDALTDFVHDTDGCIMTELDTQMAVCVCPGPAQRPSTATLLKSPLFRSDFVEIVAFIKNVTLKTDEEKKDFFSCLLPKLRCLPEEVIARKLVVPLLSRFVLLDTTAESHVVPSLLTPRYDSQSTGLLDESLFQTHVVPHLCNVFRVHDCHIRLVLLQHFHLYAPLFSLQQLKEHIFLQVLVGLRDTDDRLVAASLRALADLVPLLGGDYVIGANRKAFFFHGVPKSASLSTPVVTQASVPQGSSVSPPSSQVNVTTVLPAARSTHTLGSTNHKPPLLKDLALGGGGKEALLALSEDKERKMREREQRREEARLKREERRMKVKAKQKKEAENPELVDSDDHKHDRLSSLTIEKVATLVDSPGKFSGFDCTKGMEEETENGPRKADGWIEPLSDDEEKEGVWDGENEAQRSDGEEKSDWSDWDNADGNFSDEIEEELRGMSKVDGGLTCDRKVPTSPSPYQYDDTLRRQRSSEADWSENSDNATTTTDRNTNAICLYGVDEAADDDDVQAKVRMEGSSNGGGHGLDGGQQQQTFSGGKVLKLKDGGPSTRSTQPVKSSSLSSSSSTPSTNKAKDAADLGFGYDIKSIQVKSKSAVPSEEVDLFADMAPTIVSTSATSDPLKDIVLSISGGVGSSLSAMKNRSEDADKPNGVVSSSLFAVDSDAGGGGEEDTGWGDDGGWDVDDF